MDKGYYTFYRSVKTKRLVDIESEIQKLERIEKKDEKKQKRFERLFFYKNNRREIDIIMAEIEEARKEIKVCEGTINKLLKEKGNREEINRARIDKKKAKEKKALLEQKLDVFFDTRPFEASWSEAERIILFRPHGGTGEILGIVSKDKMETIEVQSEGRSCKINEKEQLETDKTKLELATDFSLNQQVWVDFFEKMIRPPIEWGITTEGREQEETKNEREQEETNLKTRQLEMKIEELEQAIKQQTDQIEQLTKEIQRLVENNNPIVVSVREIKEKTKTKNDPNWFKKLWNKVKKFITKRSENQEKQESNIVGEKEENKEMSKEKSFRELNRVNVKIEYTNSNAIQAGKITSDTITEDNQLQTEKVD